MTTKFELRVVEFIVYCAGRESDSHCYSADLRGNGGGVIAPGQPHLHNGTISKCLECDARHLPLVDGEWGPSQAHTEVLDGYPIRIWDKPKSRRGRKRTI